MLFGFGLATLYVVIGWATWWFAQRVGPKPVFGVRTSVTMRDRPTWNRANRIGGMMLAAMGLVLFAVVGLAAWAGLGESAINYVVVGYVLATVLVLGVWAVKYPGRWAASVSEDRGTSNAGRR